MHGDCRDVLADMEPSSVGAVVTDPPYGLGFMGKDWDAARGLPAFEADFWRLVLRVMRPGAHGLIFGGTRTFHRMACALEDAGFELRDTLCWLYGSGFPKGLNVSKAIDKAAGAPRAVLGVQSTNTGMQSGNLVGGSGRGDVNITAPATAEAQAWDGWGTALKPAWEPILLVRKPLEGTVAGNVLVHGCGGVNVDGCRVGASKDVPASTLGAIKKHGWGLGDSPDCAGLNPNIGRWPANVVLDEDGARLLDIQDRGTARPGGCQTAMGKDSVGGKNTYSGGWAKNRLPRNHRHFDDDGTISRFFYCAKASPSERGAGNNHPTVKPLSLMTWLVRLIAPPGLPVLDPFMGSGSTALACERLGVAWLGIEQDQGYCEIARRRLINEAPLFAGEGAA